MVATRHVATLLLTSTVLAALLGTFRGNGARPARPGGERVPNQPPDPSYLDYIRVMNSTHYEHDPTPWKVMADRITALVKERVGDTPYPLEALCSIPYNWVCGRGVCVPGNRAAEFVDVGEDGRFYQKGRACGPLIYLDHMRTPARSLSITRLVLRHASEMKFLNDYWEAIFNGAAFTDLHGVASVVGMVTKADQDNAVQFPRNNLFVKAMCLHAAFAMSHQVDMVFLVDNDAFFTDDAFRLPVETPFLASMFPDDKQWSFAMQDDMPFDEPCAGLFAIRRTKWSVDFLSDWWNEAASIAPSPVYKGFENQSLGCCWFHPHDQICLKLLLYRRMSGHNNFTASAVCRSVNKGWLPTARFARGQPPGLLEAMQRAGRWPGVEQKLQWHGEGGSDLVVNDEIWKRNLDWKYNQSVTPFDDEGLSPLVPRFVSQFSWPNLLWIRWNASMKLHTGAFHHQLTPFPHRKSLVYHTGSNLFKCIRVKVSFGTHGRNPPPWARTYIPMNTTHTPSFRDVSRQKKCFTPELIRLMKKKGKFIKGKGRRR